MSSTLPLSAPYWYTFIVAAGATSIAVEIAGLRYLAPLFGSSLPVWGLAIATVLAGLSLGYARGGRRAGASPAPLLVFQYAAFASAVFLWMPALFLIATRLRNLHTSGASSLALVLAFFLAYLILFIPAVIFGMVSPLAVQAEADRARQPAGQVAGRVSALNTIGSLLGILIPSFITIPFLGSQVTVWLFAGVTLALSLYVLWSHPRPRRTIIGLALIGVAAAFLLEQTDPSLLFATETEHQLIQVNQYGRGRALTFDANLGIQSVFTDNLYTRGYWDYLASLPILLPPERDPIAVLVLGAAASTTERQLERFWADDKTFQFTSVEIDRALFDVAERYFDPPARQTIAADGRLFVAADTSRYDLIIVDAYAREVTVPFHLATAEFFEQAAARLTPGGIVAVNINAVSLDTLWMQSLARTIATALPHSRVISVPHSCNHLLIASSDPIEIQVAAERLPDSIIPLLPPIESAARPPANGLLLTDNRAPTDILGIAALINTTNSTVCS